MLRHLLVQYPLLVGGGVLIGMTLAAEAQRRRRPLGWTAAPALLGGILALAFWLIPRWIDAAVGNAGADALKAASLVLLSGLPLGWGWRLAEPILRGLVWAHAAAMAAVMGGLQLSVPLRLCNAYLITDQAQTGRAFITLAVAIIILGLARALWGTRPAPNT